MSQASNKILDDFAKLMTDAAGAAQGVKREVENAFGAQADKFMANMDLVQREDFDVVREMAIRARSENERLEAKVADLEARLEALEKASK